MKALVVIEMDVPHEWEGGLDHLQRAYNIVQTIPGKTKATLVMQEPIMNHILAVI